MARAATDLSELVDQVALRRVLGDVLPPFDTMSVALLAGGASNLTFLITLDGVRYVLRRRPLGPTAARAHDMHREFTVISALNHTDFPVPRAVCFSDNTTVVGEPFFVMEFVAGTALHTSADVASLDESDARTCSRLLIDTLTRLHALDPAVIGLESFGPPSAFLERRITSWIRQWSATEHRDFPEVVALGARLLSGVPARAETTLVHGDYRLGNVLFVFDPAPRLTAVLDWEMSTLGDPLTDLAHLLVYWEPTRGRRTHPSQAIANSPGFSTGQQQADRYAKITGRDTSTLPYYLAFEHWRAAIIKDALYVRARSNDATAGTHETAELGASVRLHLEEATAVMDDL